MRIDCHHHIWLLARGDYTWLTDARSRIYRDFPADELKPLLDAAQIDATIAVQAAATEAETEFLLTQAQAHDWIVGVIGWVDIEAEDVVKSLERFKASP